MAIAPPPQDEPRDSTPSPPPPPQPQREPNRHKQLLWVVAALGLGVFLALIVTAVLKGTGASPQVQRLAAFVLVATPLSVVGFWRNVGPTDGLSTVMALVTLSAVTVAALTYVGSVERDAQTGCVNSTGPIKAVISSDSTVIYSKASATSQPRGLLTTGCRVRGSEWCVGPVHTDAIESRVFDARWLKLSGGQGFVAIGRTVSGPMPEHLRADSCEGGKLPPDEIHLRAALIDKSNGQIAVAADAPRAAFIGFAVRRGDGSWQRLGWSYSADTPTTVAFPAPDPPAQTGDDIAAVACLGEGEPARLDSSVLSASMRLADASRVRTQRSPANQPKTDSPEAAACASAIPTPADPYSPGVVKP